LRYTVDGRQRIKPTGDWPSRGLEQARIEPRRLLQQVQSGSDPFEEMRRRRTVSIIKVLAGEWLDRHATGHRSGKAIRLLIGADWRRPSVCARFRTSAVAT
jgi:hypothetical protein